MDFITQPKVRLIGSTALLAGGTLCGGVLGTSVASVVAGIIANDVIPQHMENLTVRLRDSRGQLHNHDLAEAVGLAIGLLIKARAEAGTYPGSKKGLVSLAEYTVKYWKTIAQELQTVDPETFFKIEDSQVPGLFSQALGNEPGQVLTESDWLELLQEVRGKAKLELPLNVLQELARNLRDKFAFALREVLKADFSQGGKAFAGLAISLLGAIHNGLQQVQVPQESREEVNRVLAELGKVEQELARSEGENQARFRQLSTQLGVGIEVILGEIATTQEILNRLRGWLDGELSQIGKTLKEIQETAGEIKDIASDNRRKLDALPQTIIDEFEKMLEAKTSERFSSRVVDVGDSRPKKVVWTEVEWGESQSPFLPELTFIDIEEALPGALLPSSTKIYFQGQLVTPLLPLDPILLEYLTPEDLIERVHLTLLNSSEGNIVRMELDLPLSELSPANSINNLPENYRVKNYLLKEENRLRRLPILEIWPNFQLQDWQEYYGFYYDGDAGERTFQVSFPTAQNPHIFQEGRGNYQITRLQNFPSHVECRDTDGGFLGLIVLQAPKLIKPRGTWIAGMHFDILFANIYINYNDKVSALSLENLHLQVTASDPETRIPVLFEYFLPEQFIPTSKPFPIACILTTRGSRYRGLYRDKLCPIYDGRIYFPDNSQLEDQEWVKTDMNWEWDKGETNELFLQNLILYITAQAVKQGIDEIIWSVSFPSTLSLKEQDEYAKNWEVLTQTIQQQTGVIQVSPQPDDLIHFQSESLATAQYFAVSEGLPLINATCINIGAGTSDLSIWENDTLIHQCSLRLGKRHIFSEIVEHNPDFIIRIFDLDDEFVRSQWRGLQGTKFSAKLDIYLQLYGEKWLKNQKIFLEEDPQFQGLIRLMALGLAGLYYYLGIVLGVLDYEGKLKKNEITPVYMGGNGSRLLNWLAEAGQFDQHSELNLLFSRILSKASGFEDTEEKTELSKNPGDEVACGLVLTDKALKGITRTVKDLFIAGENCEINDQLFDWKSRLEFEKKIDNFNILDLQEVRKFFNEFHLAVKELELENVTPFPYYTLAKDPNHPDSDDNPKLWREVCDELTDLLFGKTKEEGTDAENLDVEPPFILGVKALLRVLSREWAQM